MRLLSLLLLLSALTARAAETFPPANYLGDPDSFGRGVQRTMRLLATSTPEHRHTVRVLFYGQSITAQAWTTAVADDLRARFPNANLVIENRALGGFASQMLVKTAETDLYPFQPDLLIFHVFGAHDKYEDIIRRTRERTCAEILIQNDHVNARADWRHEETDPAKVSTKQWDSFMNYKHLPAVAAKYRTGFVDQRGIWKRYLTDYGLEAQALLKDGVHLNTQGEWLMAECVKQHLVYRPELGPAEAEQWVRTVPVAASAPADHENLRIEFEGNRVDLILKEGAQASPLAFLIDGKKPSEFPELYGFTPAQANPGGRWPPIAPISSEAPLLEEEWTMQVQRDSADEKLFSFSIAGSRTGPDGEGRSDTRFVSKSRRIVIAPEDWNVAYALSLAQVKSVPEKFTVKWRVVPRLLDSQAPSAIAPAQAGAEAAATIASGLANTRHLLEITGGPGAVVTALRIYRPPLARQ